MTSKNWFKMCLTFDAFTYINYIILKEVNFWKVDKDFENREATFMIFKCWMEMSCSFFVKEHNFKYTLFVKRWRKQLNSLFDNGS